MAWRDRSAQGVFVAVLHLLSMCLGLAACDSTDLTPAPTVTVTAASTGASAANSTLTASPASVAPNATAGGASNFNAPGASISHVTFSVTSGDVLQFVAGTMGIRGTGIVRAGSGAGGAGGISSTGGGGSFVSIACTISADNQQDGYVSINW